MNTIKLSLFLRNLTGVIANPPFSLKKCGGGGKEEPDPEAFGRFPYGTPPKDAGDLAFVQHMMPHLMQRVCLG